MGNAMTSLLHEVVYHPFVSVFIALICWIWIKTSFNEWDLRTYSLSMHDIVRKYQIWKVFTATVTHSSWFTLLLNVSCVWNLRYLEAYYGTWFILRYSIILVLTEALISYGLIQSTVRISGNNASIQQVLYSLQSHGCAGLILAWLSFQSIYYTAVPFPALFLLFGFINISPLLAPLIMTTIYYMMLGRNHIFANSGGLLAGYLLAFGLLQIVNNAYWTVCIFFDLLIIFGICWKWQIDEANGSTEQVPKIAFRSFTGNDGTEEFVEVLYDAEELASLVPEIPIVRRSISAGNLINNPFRGSSTGAGEEGDEESQPLLATGGEGGDEETGEVLEDSSRGRWRTFPNDSDELDISGSGRMNHNSSSSRRLYIGDDV